jgi:hypothetical protein
MSSQWLNEVEQATRVVDRVGQILNAAGVQTTTYHDTISDDPNENLNRICNFHNSKTRDLDVSVHFNASGTGGVGAEVWYVTQGELAAEVSEAIADAGHFKNRGPKYTSNLFFLNQTAKPSVLLEICFGDMQSDCDLYYKHFEAICHAIAESLCGQDIGDAPPPEAELPPDETRPPIVPEQRPTLKKGSKGPDVVMLQRTLGIPDDGDFGSITDAQVRAFQAACGIAADGIVGSQTWERCDDLDRRKRESPMGLSPELVTEITTAVEERGIAEFNWPERGVAPPAYMIGMALSFAQACLWFEAGVLAVDEMAEPEHGDTDDALTWLREEFEDIGMDNTRGGLETLRGLFVLLIGLGMRETSGQYFQGIDASAGSSSTSADTCEAGLFQTSWNMSSPADERGKMTDYFWQHPNGFLAEFSDGVYPTASGLKHYGSSGEDGVRYQFLAKFCPLFAALSTGLGLRSRKDHWGPVKRREVDLRPETDELLKDIQHLVTSVA